MGKESTGLDAGREGEVSRGEPELPPGPWAEMGTWQRAGRSSDLGEVNLQCLCPGGSGSGALERTRVGGAGGEASRKRTGQGAKKTAEWEERPSWLGGHPAAGLQVPHCPEEGAGPLLGLH